jgi:hypothetical protein
MGFNIQNWRSCLVKRSAAQSIATATPTDIIWDASEFNPDAMWVSGTNPSRVTCNKPGLYSIAVEVLTGGTVDNAASVIIRKNGSSVVTHLLGVALTAAGVITVVTDLLLATGDCIEIRFTQASGAGRDVAGSRLAVSLVHPQQDWTAATEAV